VKAHVNIIFLHREHVMKKETIIFGSGGKIDRIKETLQY
jgi:hypothetical protein